MTLEKRIAAFGRLAERIKKLTEADKEELFAKAANENPWFTPDNISSALEGITLFLDPIALADWSAAYHIQDQNKSVGIVMAGNIPLVGFHDLLCVIISGNKAMVKLSSSDSVLTRTLIGWLIEEAPELAQSITLVERLNDAEAFIATGSDNTARYFHYYFGKKPHIIRQNRTSVAILTGEESQQDIDRLGSDIFSYFGLGCRNVSKIYIPEGYELPTFLDVLSATSHQQVIDHHKYCNNYDYNKSIYLVNGDKHLDTGFLLLKEEKESLVSPISVLYYAYYKRPQQLQLTLASQQDRIQCLVGHVDWLDDMVPFGQTQRPHLQDYADGVDTMAFLTHLS